MKLNSLFIVVVVVWVFFLASRSMNWTQCLAICAAQRAQVARVTSSKSCETSLQSHLRKFTFMLKFVTK